MSSPESAFAYRSVGGFAVDWLTGWLFDDLTIGFCVCSKIYSHSYLSASLINSSLIPALLLSLLLCVTLGRILQHNVEHSYSHDLPC